MHDTNKSEVARIKLEIALQYQAATRVFTDFTATARHAFLTAHQEKLGLCLEELTQYMSPEDAMQTFIQAQAETTELIRDVSYEMTILKEEIKDEENTRAQD